MSTTTPRPTVGELVTASPLRARVFERFGIDYCCGGKIPLAEACARRGLDISVVEEALAEADGAAGPERGVDWETAPLGALVDHILLTHHAYLRDAIPRLSFLVDKVARVHGQEHAELVALANVYHQFAADMIAHMGKEEQVLFPAIKQLAAQDGPVDGAAWLAMPVGVMTREHDVAGDQLREMRRLADGYVTPEGACNSYMALFAGLAELERDTHAHVHLENNVLFPRALARAGVGE